MQNLFEILGLPTAFALDEKALEKAYFTAMRACHPDGFVGRSAADRAAAISRSQRVNDAYETLKDPMTRAGHILALQGFETLGENAKAPPALLMEQMELRERLEAADGAVLAHLIDELKADAGASVRAMQEAFDSRSYADAAAATMRLHYLNKAIEEAYMRVHRMKAMR